MVIVRIDIGIGTTNPEAPLSVCGTGTGLIHNLNRCYIGAYSIARVDTCGMIELISNN